MATKKKTAPQAQEALWIMRGHERATGRRVWLVESRSGTQANGFITGHIVWFDPSDAVWRCPCASPLPRCPHTEAASAASRAERDAAQMVRDAARDAAMPARQDTGPRWLMPTPPRPVLAERVREVM